MGADFCTIRIAIKKDKKPDFRKGYQLIRKLSKTPYDKWPSEYRNRFDDVDDAKAEAEVIKNDLADLRIRWTQGGRDFDCFNVGSRKVFITGGFTYGDEPCDLWNTLDRLTTAGVTKACGFDW